MQGGSSGIGYGLKYQARCISDVKADRDHTSFLTGTLSLKEENEVHLLRLSSGGSELLCEGLFSHPNEIWDLASCPFDQRIFSTVFSTGESFGAAIWQIPEPYGQSNSSTLECVASLDAHVGKINCVLWCPSGNSDKLISMDEQNLVLWSLDSSKKSAEVLSKESAGMRHSLSGGAWNPHDVNSVAATSESSIQFWDLRTMKKVNSIERAHVRNVDYNLKREHILVSADDESGIHLWDLRKTNVPVQELPGHTHWTCAVRCNPEYEELILSVGTDSAVNLWFASASSENKTSGSLVEASRQRVNPLLNSYTDYEDSVYGLAWSLREPWIFASLSYDGRHKSQRCKNKPRENTHKVNEPTHWTWAVRCNPEYEELILSVGTDSAVNLWFASASSENKTSGSPVEASRQRVNPLLNSYTDYEDSVYGLAWSSREPWIFASLSYDGRVVIESVKPFLPRR